nr:MAG TPA: hypothetical protein [Bacteriophage sp.]
MIRNKEYKIQILLENFKEVEKSENCKNVADYAKIESVADDGFYPWLFEDDYSKVLTSEQEHEFEDFLNELRENY